jgi:hypothetical protein
MNQAGRFVRWQSITLAQLGYTLNVILGLATASLGFAFVSLKQSDFELGKARCPFNASLLLLFGSIACGIWCSVNRLCDFRQTARIARREQQLFREDKELKTERQEVKRLGQRTWTIFWWQIGLFAAGETLLGLAFVIVYHSKLF